jgi:trehalose-6-phosphate synthase
MAESLGATVVVATTQDRADELSSMSDEISLDVRYIAVRKSSYSQYKSIVKLLEHAHLDDMACPPLNDAQLAAFNEGYYQVNLMASRAIAALARKLEGCDRPPLIIVVGRHFSLSPRLIRDTLGRRQPILFFPEDPIPSPDRWKRSIGHRLMSNIMLGWSGADVLACQRLQDADHIRMCFSDPIFRFRPGLELFPVAEGTGEGWPAVPFVHLAAAGMNIEAHQEQCESPAVRKCASNLRARLGSDVYVFATASRLALQKNLLKTVDAYDAALAAYPSMRRRTVFVMLLHDDSSCPQLRSELQQRCTSINERYSTRGEVQPIEIHWNPPRIVVEALLRLARAFVLSGWESQGLALAEAVAVSHPMPDRDGWNSIFITSVAAGISDSVLSGPASLHISPNDLAGMRESFYHATVISREEAASMAKIARTRLQAVDVTETTFRLIAFLIISETKEGREALRGLQLGERELHQNWTLANFQALKDCVSSSLPVAAKDGR